MSLGPEERLARLEGAVGDLVVEVRALATRLGSAATAAPCPLERVWEGSPLAARLAFLRAVLGPGHPLQSSFQEAAGLVELCDKGAELEAWLVGYPTVFADSAARLCPPFTPDPAASGAPVDAELLARETLTRIREALDRRLAAAGVEWIDPPPGTGLSADHEVLGEEAATGIPPGRVARVHRPGFRQNGVLRLPAQVYRAGISAVAPDTAPGMESRGSAPVPAPAVPAGIPADPVRNPAAAPEPVPGTPGSTGRDPGPAADGQGSAIPFEDAAPEWLRALLRSVRGAPAPAGREVIDALTGLATPESTKALADGEMARWLAPLLPFLGPAQWSVLQQYPAEWVEALARAREALLDRLTGELGIALVAPAEGAQYDPSSMEVTSERRTAHPHERGTVARLEQAGLRREGRLLVRARVIRYEPGEAE